MKFTLLVLLASLAASASAMTNSEFMRRAQLERGVIMPPVVYKKPVGKIVRVPIQERVRRAQLERGVIMPPVVYKKPVGKIVRVPIQERIRRAQIERGVIHP